MNGLGSAGTEPEPRTRAELERAIRWHVRVLGTDMAETHRLLAARLHVNPTQLRAVDRLHRRGDQTAGELSRALGLTTGSTTSMVDGLVDSGHVVRVAHPGDRRKAVVRATARSAAAAREALEPFRAALLALLARYDDADLALLERFLRDLSAEVRAHAARLEHEREP